jgi:cysteinyl-tRNA synthetase
VAVQDDKEDPLDFVLWKAAKPDEPDEAKLGQPLRPRAPGLAHRVLGDELRLLGEHFDIHGGGMDLQFPHHENEIAQSEGANGGPFVNTGCTTAF